jgi:hypothetical protein
MNRTGTESAERDDQHPSIEEVDELPRRKKKKSLVEAWWDRFLRTNLSDLRRLPPSVESMLHQHPSTTITTSLDLFDVKPLSVSDINLVSDASLTPEQQQQILSTRILFMYNMDSAEVIRIIMHVFFYAVMYHPDPDRWRVDLQARKKRKRIARLLPRDIDALYAHFTGQYPNVAMDRETFSTQLKEWRRLGSIYVFIAARLGLGSLLYLQDLILPTRCWGATKGGEKGGASERALEHLETIGLPEMCEESGANRCVSDLLRNLCHGFGSFDLGDLDPHGPRRSPESDLEL